jgi:uncharacterized protein YbjT (DUF2867 family)
MAHARAGDRSDGLIGGAVVARLIEAGHEVVAVARRTGHVRRSVPDARWLALDIATMTEPRHWLPHLAGVDAVVNCAGVLQDSPRDSTQGVHVDGIGALFAACERTGPRRVVQISAMGVDRHAATDFSRTKLAGDNALMQRDLDWVILRPSVVLGPAAYGGSALFRGLAVLPLLPAMPDAGPLQVVQLEDVVATTLFFLSPGAPSRVALDLAGPDHLSFAEMISQYRGWLGWPEPRLVRVPGPIAALLFRLGDVAGWLGWRPPLRSTALYEIRHGAVGDPRRWIELTGIVPRSLRAALASRPASVQERWFAGLYLLKPVIFVVLSLFWIATGALSLGPAYPAAVRLAQEAGGGSSSGVLVLAGGLADIAIGIGIAFRRTSRAALWAAFAVSVFYLITLTVTLPLLWTDPLGPLLKIAPIVALNLVALAILEDR